MSNERQRPTPLLDIALAALTVLFGLQTLRLFMPTVMNYYGVQPGVTFTLVGIVALGVFAIGLLAGVIFRLLGPALSLVLTAGGVALIRLLLQLDGQPPHVLILSAVGVVLFLWSLPLLLGLQRSSGAPPTSFAAAVLLGLATDTALHGAAGTYDLGWQHSTLPLLVIAILVAIHLTLLVYMLRRRPLALSDAPLSLALLLIAIGPFLVLEELIFQNVAALTVLTGWAQPLVLAWILIANIAALAVALAAPMLQNQQRRLGTIAAILLILLVALPQSGPLAAIWLLVGQVLLAHSLATIVAVVQGAPAKPGFRRVALGMTLGTLVFALLVFLYYIPYDVRMPYQNLQILILAAIIVAVCERLAAYRSSRQATTEAHVDWRPVWVAAGLLLLPLIVGITWSQPKAVTGNGLPVRVMTYNLHFGYDTDGYLAMEALAKSIEEQNPAIVGLQEVSRGWYISGSIDMLTWLSRRLDMPYVFAPASDAIWGNALLSKYPISDWGMAKLPWFGEPLKRSFLWAQVDLGQGESLLFTTLHTHQLEGDSTIRQAQVAEVIKFWDKRPRAIIVGDMNALPSDPEMELFRQAGMVDSWAKASTAPGLTYISFDPYERIDYIWLSPDFSPSNPATTQSTASDHLGVAVTVGK